MVAMTDTPSASAASVPANATQRVRRVARATVSIMR